MNLPRFVRNALWRLRMFFILRIHGGINRDVFSFKWHIYMLLYCYVLKKQELLLSQACQISHTRLRMSRNSGFGEIHYMLESRRIELEEKMKIFGSYFEPRAKIEVEELAKIGDSERYLLTASLRRRRVYKN